MRQQSLFTNRSILFVNRVDDGIIAAKNKGYMSENEGQRDMAITWLNSIL